MQTSANICLLKRKGVWEVITHISVKVSITFETQFDVNVFFFADISSILGCVYEYELLLILGACSVFFFRRQEDWSLFIL